MRRINSGQPPFLGLTVLVKDAANIIEDLLRSVLMPSLGPAFDEYVFVDTGSTDGTVEIIERWTHFAEDYCVKLSVVEAGASFVESGHFNFAAARNFAFSKLTSEWRMWLDADDRMLGSDFLWALLRKEPEDVNCVSFKYDYTGQGAEGSVWQDAKRIFRYPSGAVLWKGFIHEQPTAVGQHRIDAIDTPLKIGPPWNVSAPFHAIHANANHDRSIERNEKSLRYLYTTSNDPIEKARAAHFLGHIEARRGNAAAKGLLQESIQGNQGNYLGLLSYVALAEYLLETEDDADGAIDVLGAAHAQAPELPEPLWVLGQAWKAKGDISRAARFFYLAATMPDQAFRPHRNKLVEDHLGPMWTVEALRRCGQYAEALKIIDTRLAGSKDDLVRQLGNQLAHARYRSDLVDWARRGVYLLDLANEGTASSRMLQSLPAWFSERIPELRAMQIGADNKVAHLYDKDLYQARYAAAFKDTSLTCEQLATISSADRVVWMKGYVKDGAHVLAIGPHGGFFEAEILRKLPNVCMRMVEASDFGKQELLKKWKPEFGDRIEVTATLDASKWPDGPFDIIESFEVIEHVTNVSDFLGNMLSRLADDGKILLSTPDAEYWTPDLPAPAAEWYGHVRTYTPALLHDELRKSQLYVSRMVRSSENLLLSACEKLPATHASLSCDAGRRVDILAPGYVPFDAEAHMRGLVGGSEEAIIHLAPRLAGLGYTVNVFANVGEDDLFSSAPRSRLLVKDNVLWEPIEHFQPDCPNRHALIIWRNSTVLEQPAFKSMKCAKVVWLHDAVLDNPTALEKADAVVCVSETHERFMRRESASHERNINWRHVQNGIDPPAFPAPNDDERDTHRAIYLSSPDRGLETLLEIWPEIVKDDHKANLHIYYGFSSASKMARGQAPHVARHFRGMKERVLQSISKLKNVVWHDGVSHPELHDALRKSGVWLYPHLPSDVETSCIAAMKVLACGVWPVVSDAGALKETCFVGSFTPAEALKHYEGTNRFAQLALCALNGEVFNGNGKAIKLDAELRRSIHERAVERFDWQIAAKQMAEILNDACGD